MNTTADTTKFAQTSCWDCCAVYPMEFDKCPTCDALNANHNQQGAVEQMQQRSDNMMAFEDFDWE